MAGLSPAPTSLSAGADPFNCITETVRTRQRQHEAFFDYAALPALGSTHLVELHPITLVTKHLKQRTQSTV